MVKRSLILFVIDEGFPSESYILACEIKLVVYLPYPISVISKFSVIPDIL